jgi:hypothetical protein
VRFGNRRPFYGGEDVNNNGSAILAGLNGLRPALGGEKTTYRDAANV